MKSMKLGIYEMDTHTQHSDLVSTFTIFGKLKCEIMISAWWLHLSLCLLISTSELVHQCCTETEYYSHYWICNTKNAPWVTMTRDETCKFSFFWHNSPQWARASSFMRFLEHTQWRTTVGRTPLDELSARRRDLCQHTTLTRDKHPCPQWDSNPQSEQVSGCKPMP